MWKSTAINFITKILSDPSKHHPENLEQSGNQYSVPTNSLTHSHNWVIEQKVMVQLGFDGQAIRVDVYECAEVRL